MKRALVLSLIFAVGLGFAGFAQTLSGSWDTDICLDMTATTWNPAGGNNVILSVTSEVVVTYVVGDWSFSSETDLTDGVWTNQDFDYAGVLGAFTISGDLEFNPVTGSFVSLEANVAVSIAGVTFGANFDLVPGGTDLILSGSGVAGDVTIAVELRLGDEIGCDFDFTSVEIDISFPFCCATIAAEIMFDCTMGFNYAEFCFEDLTIENLPWLSLGGCITFQTQSKVFSITPTIDLGVIGCDFDLYFHHWSEDVVGGIVEPAMGWWQLEGIRLDGIQIACEIGGVQFTGISYWSTFAACDSDGDGVPDDAPGLLCGYGFQYWEAYQIATTDDGCCGPFGFDVTVFFDANATSLFDVAYLVANVELQVASQFAFTMGIETDVDLGTVDNICFGFEVTW